MEVKGFCKWKTG